MAEPMKQCPVCGEMIPAGSVVCPVCGEQIIANNEQTPPDLTQPQYQQPQYQQPYQQPQYQAQYGPQGVAPSPRKSNTPLIMAIAVVALAAIGAAAFFLLKDEEYAQKAEKTEEVVAEAPTDTGQAMEAEVPVTQTAPEPAPEPAQAQQPTMNVGRYEGVGSAPDFYVGGSDPRFQEFDYLQSLRLTPADLQGLGTNELRVLRNAIFAMHGYRFKSADLQQYFGQFDWYMPQYSDVTNQLNSTEKHNIELIKSYE